MYDDEVERTLLEAGTTPLTTAEVARNSGISYDDAVRILHSWLSLGKVVSMRQLSHRYWRIKT